MIKRLLAFVLTAAMVIETPATALAAGQIPVTAEDSLETPGEGQETEISSDDETENVEEISEEINEGEGEIVFDLIPKEGETNTVNLVIEDEENEDKNKVGAYAFKRRFALEAADGQAALSGGYGLHLYLKESAEGDDAYAYAGFQPEHAFDEDNEYKLEEVWSGDIPNGGGLWLHPDTTYDLRWVVTRSAADGEEFKVENILSEAVGIFEETITTKEAGISIEPGADNGYEFNVTFIEDSLGAPSLSLYAYLREHSEGDDTLSTYDIDTEYQEELGENFTLSLDDFVNEQLKSGALYDIALLAEYEEETGVYNKRIYKTQEKLFAVEDERKLDSDVSIDEGETSVSFEYDVTGVKGGDNTYVLLYYAPYDTSDLERSAWELGGSDYKTDGDYRCEITVNDLEPGTRYSYILGLCDSEDVESFEQLIDKAEGDFTTLSASSTRKVELKETKVTPYQAILNYTLSGVEDYLEANNLEYTYLVSYYREKDATVWEDGDAARVSEDGDDYLMLLYLTPETEYEYVVGFGIDGDGYYEGEFTPKNDLINTVEGEFTTADISEDDRVITASVDEVGTTRAKISWATENADNLDWVILYYREKNKQEQQEQEWKLGDETQVSRTRSFEIRNLNPETVYEYKIGFSFYHDTEASELYPFTTGEFSTSEDTRSLSNASVDVITTGAAPTASIDVLFINPDLIDSDLHYFYKKKDAEQWTEYAVENVYEEVSTLVSMEINGLEWDAAYDYAIAVTLWRDKLASPDDAKLTYKGEFETPKAELPTKITLSQDKVYLSVNEHNDDWDEDIDDYGFNARNYYDYEAGYAYQEIKAEVEPASAKGRFAASSSNTDVAEVTQNGNSIIVYARGRGEAEITVKVPGTDTVLTACTVTVEDYKIQMDDDFVMSNVTGHRLSYPIYSRSTETYHLYNGNEEVSTFTVTSADEEIASWESDTKKLLTGTKTGVVKLTFTAENYNVPMYVRTTQRISGAAIAGLGNDSYSSDYAAIADGNNSYIVAVGNTYYPQVEAVPLGSYHNAYSSEFTWSSDHGEIASVNDYGTITAVSEGTATITAKAKAGYGYPDNFEMSITVKVMKTPDSSALKSINVLANTVTKLSDIDCPDGWKWKEPNTPLVANKNDGDSYAFDVVGRDGYYPYKAAINANIAKVTGIVLSSNVSDGVLEVSSAATGNPDVLTMTVNADYEGYLNAYDKTYGYQGYEIDIPEIDGLVITKGTIEDGRYRNFTITAAKAGTYTLKPVIKVTTSKGEKTLAQTSYKIKAVEGPIVSSIEITADRSDGINEGVYSEGNCIYVEKKSSYEIDSAIATEVDTIVVNAVLKDHSGNAPDALKDTKLTWKISDAKVAKVTVDSTDSHKATIKVIGEGHAVLTAAAKDAAGRSGVLNVEIRSYAPRVSASSITVNTAYDYENRSWGLEYADKTAGIDVVPAYGEYINNSDIAVCDNSGNKIDNFNVYSYDTGRYVIGPKYNDDGKTAEITSGQYKLRVVSRSGNSQRTYEYPLEVTVVKKAPKVTIKSSKTVNLFYTVDRAQVTVKAADGSYIESLIWKDLTPDKAGDGFASEWEEGAETKSGINFSAAQENIELTNKNKLADANAAKGKFEVKLVGYRDKIESSQVTLKCNYKKPALVTKNSSTTIVPSVKNHNTSTFYIYNKTDKCYIDDSKVYNEYGDDYYYAEYMKYYYDKVTCDNSNVEVDSVYYYDDYYDYGYSYVRYTYNGSSKKSEKISLTLKSPVWRENLTAVHTIKVASPTAVLGTSQLTINTNEEEGMASTYMYLKNNNYILACNEIAVEGKDAKSSALLDKGQLEIRHDPFSNYYDITVIQNRAKTAGEAISPGTYTYKLTPYYTDADGTVKAMNTVLLKVKVVNKAITAKTKVKGSLDLAKSSYYENSYYSYYYNSMTVTTTFSNMGTTDYDIYDMKLVGEYADYFYLSGSRLYIKEFGKLKANQKYKLAIEYTIIKYVPYEYVDEYGYAQIGYKYNEYTITGNTFTVTPKQSAPKITVDNDNQTIYLGAANSNYLTKYYYMYAPYQYNDIDYVDGSIDCNKDGKADITVSGSDGWVIVKVVDRDAVLTTTGAKGKTYSIPVTVYLEGRDGVSKDAKATIKVTIKR